MVSRSLCMRKALGSNPSGSIFGSFERNLCRSFGVQSFPIRDFLEVFDIQRKQQKQSATGDLAQMVERSLSMREALGSMPSYSILWISRL